MTGVSFTLRHAQAFLLNICSDRTIIVGHAVHHDLKALKLNHGSVIDSAYFFGIENEPGHHASVRDISEKV
jgi:RNA exonuclease 1